MDVEVAYAMSTWSPVIL